MSLQNYLAIAKVIVANACGFVPRIKFTAYRDAALRLL